MICCFDNYIYNKLNLIVCYSKGIPDAQDGFVHTLASLDIACTIIDGLKSNESITYQSPEFELPKGVAGFLTKLKGGKYLLANDSVNNEQPRQTYFYIGQMKLRK